MARQLRIQFAGAWYHGMNRGARRQPIFESDADRQSFLSLLGDAYDRFGFEVHAYCLMSNHYHLLIHTPDGNLSEAMRYINGVHTQRFNAHNGTDGPLFRGRFKSPLVDTDQYLLHASSYIHMNPVKPGLANSPADYRWSSFSAYAGLARAPSWLRTATILNMVGGATPRQTYARATEMFVPDPELERAFAPGQTPLAIGSEQFKASIARRALELTPTEPTEFLEPLDRAVARAFEVTVASLQAGTRGRRNTARAAAVAIAHELAEIPLAALARHYGFSSTSGVSNAIARLRDVEDSNPSLANKLKELWGQVSQLPDEQAQVDIPKL